MCVNFWLLSLLTLQYSMYILHSSRRVNIYTANHDMIHFLNNLNTFYTENRKIEFKISDWLQRNDWFRIHYSSMTKQLKILRNAAGPKFNKNLSQLVNIIFNLLGWEHIQTSTFDDFHSRSYTILRNLNLKKVICTFSGTTKKKTNHLTNYSQQRSILFSSSMF